jgi:RNA polymerase sigma factor (sigma-70 family)
LRATAGDAAARDEIVKDNLPMVLREAAGRAHRGVSVGDLFQEGTVALLEAIARYEASNGPSFSDYAEQEVAGRMDEAVEAAAAAQRDEADVVAAAEEFQRVEMALARELRRRPAAPEIAERLEWPLEKVESIAALVELARQRHDEEIIPYLEDAGGAGDDEGSQDGHGS